MTTKCQGENCTSTDGHNHSTECLFDHFTAYTQAQREHPEVQAKLKKAYFDGYEAGLAHTPPVQAEPARNPDVLALNAAREIMALVYGPTPLGRSPQLLAQIQCVVSEAIVYAAPVALKSAPVVMPDRRIQALAGVSLFDLGHAKGWNACLDEVARLNRSKTNEQ